MATEELTAREELYEVASALEKADREEKIWKAEKKRSARSSWT